MGFLRGSQTDISPPLEPGEAYDWLILCSLVLCSEWAFYACFEGFFLRALRDSEGICVWDSGASRPRFAREVKTVWLQQLLVVPCDGGNCCTRELRVGSFEVLLPVP